LDADSDTIMTDFIYPITANISDITMDLWGGAARGADNDTLDVR